MWVHRNYGVEMVNVFSETSGKNARRVTTADGPSMSPVAGGPTTDEAIIMKPSRRIKGRQNFAGVINGRSRAKESDIAIKSRLHI